MASEAGCPKCDGCGQVADTEDQEPWSAWAALPLRSAGAEIRPAPARPWRRWTEVVAVSDERYAFRCSCGCSLVSTLPGSANCPDCDKEMEPADAIPTPAPTAPTAPALGQTIGRLVYGGRGTPNPHPVRFRMEQIAAASAVAAEARRTAPAPTAPAQPQGRSDREQVALALAALPIGKRKRVLVEALRADDSMRAEVFAVVSSLGHLREYGGQLTVAEARERVVRLAKCWESSAEAGATDALLHAVMELKDAEEAAPAATAPTHPAPDEVESLTCLLRHAEAEASALGRPQHEAMATAAVAWADRRYGGQVAALRGALAQVVRWWKAPVDSDPEAPSRHATVAAQENGGATAYASAKAALALTASAAEAAGRRLAFLADRLALINGRSTGTYCVVTPCSKCGMDTGGRTDDPEWCRWCIADELADAAKSFAARGGRR